MTQVEDENAGAIWVRTQPDPDDGVFRLRLEIDADTSILLDRDLALRYTEYIATQVSRARFDAKVFSQLVKTDSQMAAYVVMMLRETRTRLMSPVPLEVIPGVTPEGVPFLRVHHGKPLGQWSLADAQSHCAAIIEGIHLPELETTYLAMLTSTIGLDERTARAMIGALSGEV